MLIMRASNREEITQNNNFKNDERNVSNMFNKISNFNLPDNVKIYGLGNIKDDKVRPFKVEFQNPQTVKHIMININFPIATEFIKTKLIINGNISRVFIQNLLHREKQISQLNILIKFQELSKQCQKTL